MCTGEETCESLWPTNASLFAANYMYLQIYASLFGQGFAFLGILLLYIQSLVAVDKYIIHSYSRNQMQ